MPKKKVNKVGRPKMAKGEAKGVVMQTRIQPDERSAFEKAAQKKGLGLSEWVRQTLNNAVKQ
jgi:predicted HicB family RNase H-like nuclease